MFARRIKSEQPTADTVDTVASQPGNVRAAKFPDMKAEIPAIRKPSERFMRRSIEAKGRASLSERRRLADLARRLRKTAEHEAVLNEVNKLSCCRPVAERPPG